MNKGFNRLAVSVLSVSILASYTSIIPSIVANADEIVSDGFSIAGEIGLDTDSDAVASELEQLSSINDNEVPDITVTKNNEVSQIFGTLSESDVNTQSDALDVIDEISNLLGINNAYSDLKFESCTESLYNDIYSFKQYYNGLEMVNSYVTVIVNKNTREPKCLNNTYISDLSISIVPHISAAEALNIVQCYYENYSGSYPRLVIYTDEDGISSLAWECNAETLTTGKIYIDAENGGILYEENLAQPASLTYDGSEEHYFVDNNYYMPNKGSFYIELDHDTSAKKFFFRDKKRNIALIPSNDYWAEFDKNNKVHIYTSSGGNKDEIFDTNYKSNVLSQLVYDDYDYECLKYNLSEVAALHNIEKAYDFYNNNFKWQGADGIGNTLYILPELRRKSGWTVNNAYAFNGRNFLAFGAEGAINGNDVAAWGADPDIAVHEFTHLVSHKKLGWGGSENVEIAALNEAYSDIMAEYADETPEWKMGNDLFFKIKDDSLYIRNIVKPQSPSLIKYNGEGSLSKTEPHDASTIISHVAYMMHYMGIEDEVGMRIWYGSMDYLKNAKEINFKACRKAVLEAIGDAVYDRTFNGKYNDCWWDYTLMTSAAFSRSNILPDYALGDINCDGSVDEDDARLLQLHLDEHSSLTTEQLLIADINKDSYVDWDDWWDIYVQ